ncbi:histidine decarboxylase, pyruvoyl type [Streptoalloteichus hindustanus]|uniref:histidine decarboxylase n=1 Tax=Streptoalloteichus hindustanus TaxID=2017 RepID=A0A1M5IB77_STRHI|nr:histidine decarboxylase, pyruvoyl type [Streptoalloteichus hindustanus]SHG25043.1 histidine decarboxylase [Streptoalloteichus hindustanus]
MPAVRKRLEQVVGNAIGSHERNCTGYLNPVGPAVDGSAGTGYVATMKLSVGKVPVEDLDEGTSRIVSYDRCEKNDAYIGQINMVTASSFCGVDGALWGYDLVRVPEDRLRKRLRLVDLDTLPGPDVAADCRVPVYEVAPLLDATERLFGRVEATAGGTDRSRLRLPPAPGAHVVCANKDASVRGPAYVWSIIAIAIAEDPDVDASLFIEDCDVVKGGDLGPKELHTRLWWHLSSVAKSIMYCGQNQGVRYREIFAGCRYLRVGAKEWGCALACAPYVLLAGKAVPPKKTAKDLLDLDLERWEELLGWKPLPPHPFDPDVGGIGIGLPRRPDAGEADEGAEDDESAAPGIAPVDR